MNADTIRSKFLNFFKKKSHKIIESDSLVPKDDPTVLFTPAGMNQFKKQFLGYLTGFSRATTSQRCLRTGDLEKVGKTTGHHTFFEMLGNFSFGDYFKSEAISWAWEFLTKELNISKDKLWVSVYFDDLQAYKIWREEIGVPEEKILKLGDKDNFWPQEAKQKGPNGPCGPCSEIFYDYGIGSGCGKPDCNPSCDCGRFIEIWNLVFTQFNRREDGSLEALPKKNIDTGMGLERLTAVMQSAQNNFETELFQPLIEEILSGAKNTDSKETKPLVYAVSDHLRAIVFAIFDGVMPSNEGRGYVIRKIIRKSILHLRTLGIKQPFLNRLVPVLAEIMKKPYPELDKRRENIAQIILAEEKNFITTLNSSDAILKEKFIGSIRKPNPKETGIIAFELYDTYGLPYEITKDWLSKHNIEISDESFQNQMSLQKERSKSKSSMKGEVFSMQDLHLDIKPTKFSGFKESEIKAKILGIFKDNKQINKAVEGDQIKIILDKTVFYAESGGQVGDTGRIIKGKNIMEVLDTKRCEKTIIHIAIIKKGSFKKSDSVKAIIDVSRRQDIARNHTATHLMQTALRDVLGGHVKQQGSLVAPERLRFDFTHFKSVTKDELTRIEELVNGYILQNLKLQVKTSDLKLAKRNGALAFFAEKYEDKVRVINIGEVSKELCGGSHLNSTGQIGYFKIVQESAVAQGIRRIEAVTGRYAWRLAQMQQKILTDISQELGVPLEKLETELEKRLERIKILEKQLNSQKTNMVQDSVESIIEGAGVINGIKLITKVLPSVDMDMLRKTVDLIKSKTKNCIVALGSVNKGRVLLVLGITPELTAGGKDASALIKELGPIIGGSGGGRPDFAQAGGNNPDKFPDAFNRLRQIIGA